MQYVIVNIPTLQSDVEARAVFKQEPDGSYLRLNVFVVPLILLVAVTFQ
jgi:hypothetical protein